MLIWSRLVFGHFQAEAASTSLPVSCMVGRPLAACSGNTNTYQRPPDFATGLEQTAACSTHSCILQKAACPASPEMLSTAQLPCCSCQPALLTRIATLPAAPEPGRKRGCRLYWHPEQPSDATHHLSSGSVLTEWRAQTTFDWTGG